MNNTGKTITAITTAAAIGTGVLLTVPEDTPQLEPEQQKQVEFVDDIEPFDIPIYTVPTIDILAYTVDVPSVDLPKIAVLVGGIMPIEIYSPEQIKIVTAIVEKIGVENLSPAQIKVLVTIVDVVEVDGYSIETVKIATQVVESVGVENLSPVQIRIIVAAIDRLDGDIPKIQQLQRVLAATMRDQRMIQYDRTLSIYNDALTAWLEIYSKPLPAPIAYIPLPRGIRMIAELRSSDHAAENLAFYRQRGYNSCLVTIDGTESASDVLQLVNLVRSAGMAAWIAWAGPEKLEWSIYQQPSKIIGLLRAAAQLCQGYICAWRRTSAHLVAQDPQYLEYLVQQVRLANPAICIVGESYYGQTWENLPDVNRRGWEARDNTPRNQSGIMIAGIATQGFAVEAMLRGVFARWASTPRLALVLGDRPYYASSNSTGRSFAANLRIKQQLERRFLRAGCIGTVTIHGDGSDRGSTVSTVDDLGKYKID
ncbi:MAG: hypothetical protein WCT05_14455 [Lentisphaeria bacterium]